jgi:hypothetical protein
MSLSELDAGIVFHNLRAEECGGRLLRDAAAFGRRRRLSGSFCRGRPFKATTRFNRQSESEALKKRILLDRFVFSKEIAVAVFVASTDADTINDSDLTVHGDNAIN